MAKRKSNSRKQNEKKMKTEEMKTEEIVNSMPTDFGDEMNKLKVEVSNKSEKTSAINTPDISVLGEKENELKMESKVGGTIQLTPPTSPGSSTTHLQSHPTLSGVETATLTIDETLGGAMTGGSPPAQISDYPTLQEMEAILNVPNVHDESLEGAMTGGSHLADLLDLPPAQVIDPVDCIPNINEINDSLLSQAANVWRLSGGIQVEVCSWRGQRRVDIRQLHANGTRSRTGIAVSLPRFHSFKMNLKLLKLALDDVVKCKEIDFKAHLGGGMYAYVKSPYQCIQIRGTFMRGGQMLYSKFKGISLKTPQVSDLINLIPTIDANHPDVMLAISCQFQHDNERQVSTCAECHPYLYMVERM